MKQSVQHFALLSVYNKQNITELAKTLIQLGYTIISTGGTYEYLKKDGIEVTPIEDVTGNPRDSFDGRIKTISFQIESGILFDRKNADHVKQAKDLNVPQIDIVVCNLYPFEQTVSNPEVTKDEAILKIDVGGPTMIRAAAKNYENVLVLVDPADYHNTSNALVENKVTAELKQKLSAKAFFHLSFYDAQIARFLSTDMFPDELAIPLRKVQILRYGENPHQEGFLYSVPNTNSQLAKLEYLYGRKLSGTNLGDIFAGIETVSLHSEPAACVIKHHSPCGVATGESIKQALERAIEADPVSAFGGVVVLNRPMDLQTADIISSFRYEKNGNIDIIAVPKISADALEILKKVRKTMGIYVFGDYPRKRSEKWDMKWLAGSALLQSFDDNVEDGFKDWKVVTDKKPSKKMLELAKFGFKVVKAVRSNAVLVVDKNIPLTRGIGAGQTSRVGATNIALEQAGVLAKNGILVSDSFFPFDDCVKMSAKYKIALIVQQGSSINDDKSIKAANDAGIAMVFTSRRAFRH